MLEPQMLVNILRSMEKFFTSLGSTTILPDMLIILNFSDIRSEKICYHVN
jgi:hypothetical protein